MQSREKLPGRSKIVETLPYWVIRNFKKAGGSSYTPADEPDIGLWLDPTELSTVTKDGSDNVSSFTSRNGLYGPFTAAGALQPVWTPAAVNGQPALALDTTRAMVGPTSKLAVTTGTPCWGWLAFKPNPPGGGTYCSWFAIDVNSSDGGLVLSRKLTFILGNAGDNYSKVWICFLGTAGTGGSGATAGVYSATVDFADGAQHLMLFSYNGGTITDPASWTMYMDNNLVPLSAGGSGNGAVATSNLFSWDDGSLKADGFFLEQAIFTATALTATKLHNTLAYCNGKWATPAPTVAFLTSLQSSPSSRKLLGSWRTGLGTVPPMQPRWGKISATVGSLAAAGAAAAHYFFGLF